MQKYRRVAYEDRCHISSYLEIGISYQEIAERLKFHRSTIWREVKRNQSRLGYQTQSASQKAKERYRRCRRKKIITRDLKEKIVSWMKEGWSPEQIAGRFSKEQVVKVSRQTIYRSLLKRRLEVKYLRTFGKRGAGRRLQRRARAKGKLSIHARPSIVQDRKRLGDWERDGMYVSNRKQLLVMLDRKSRYIKLAKMEEGTSKFVNEKTQEVLKSLGRRVYTLTNDNGTEFSHSELMPYPVYYCDPFKPGQRGSIENGIGLLRQYVKRKTKIEEINKKELTNLENKLNFRPRKCLKFRTPHEVFYQTNVALVV